MATGSVRAVEALIQGRVQRVYYRGWTEEQATRLGLCGWVRNNPDGTVSVMLIGPTDAVSAMLAACWQGPRDAEVSALDTTEITPPPTSRGFRILR